MKDSEPIAAFLDYLRDTARQCKQATSDEKLADGQTQDILHRLELYADDYHETARLAKKLREVRETWTFDTGDPEGEIGTGVFVYRADCEESPTSKWSPSIHMPKIAARIFLRVTDVRVERLQDITYEQAEKEGCNDYTSTACGFFDVWDKTIKPKDIPLYGWDANPWVWVIEFDRISKEEAFA